MFGPPSKAQHKFRAVAFCQSEGKRPKRQSDSLDKRAMVRQKERVTQTDRQTDNKTVLTSFAAHKCFTCCSKEYRDNFNSPLWLSWILS